MFGLGTRKAPWRRLVARADEARDAKRFAEAAALYTKALNLDPTLGGIHIQAGHMNKEAGAYDDAERHYEAAARLMPESAELALQFGHFYKTMRRFEDAARAYRRALELKPGWFVAEAELAGMRRDGWRGGEEAVEALRAQPVITLDDLGADIRPDNLKLAGLYDKLAPELLPRPLRDLMRHSGESVSIRQFGIRQNSFWGERSVARGVEAIRGVCVSPLRLLTVQAAVNGIVLHKGPLIGPFELEYEPD